MKRILLTAILLITLKAAASGDVRLRLYRRFPGCRGTLEHVYSGDEWAFMERIDYFCGRFRGVVLLEKDRGENWVDLVTGGLSVTLNRAATTTVYAGWLRAQFGSGLVFAHPGEWSASDPVSFSKPPAIRNRLDLSRSSWTSDGNAITGIAGRYETNGLTVSLLQGLSWIDRSEGGYHRTSGEIDSKGSIREILSSGRVTTGPFGFTAAAGWERDSASTDWQRAGLDWRIEKDAFLFCGETAASRGAVGMKYAFWVSATQSLEGYMHTFTVSRLPEDYADNRSSSPGGSSTAEPGLKYGFRWKILRGTTLAAGAGILFRDGNSSLTASSELTRRFSSGLEGRMSFKLRENSPERSWRGLAQSTWEPVDRVSVTCKVQLTGWSETDSTESGTAVELRFKYSPIDALRLSTSAAGFSTDGYNSRVYAAELAFPGEFGSIPLYGDGFLLQASVSLKPSESIDLRARIAWQQREGADHLGSGWEETEGGSRTEAGIQLDYSF